MGPNIYIKSTRWEKKVLAGRSKEATERTPQETT